MAKIQDKVSKPKEYSGRKGNWAICPNLQPNLEMATIAKTETTLLRRLRIKKRNS